MRNVAPLLALLLSGCPEGEVVDTGPVGGPPVAVCTSPEGIVQPLGREIVVDASASTDPDGDELIYEWTLAVKPEGSVAEMEDRDQAISRFTPDVEGEYGAFVTVFDSTGQFSEACRVAATSFVLPEPPREVDEDEGLRIELTWDNAGDDLDLHLLRPEDGELAVDEPNETVCYWLNCIGESPDWGVIGEVSDDPLLIEDDLDGTGPEVTYIQDPGPGVFRAVIRDFPNGAEGVTNATVTVFWNGDEVAQDQRTFDDTEETEGLYIWSLDIDVENETYTPVDEQPPQPE